MSIQNSLTVLSLRGKGRFFYFYFIFFFTLLFYLFIFLVVSVIHWHESAMDMEGFFKRNLHTILQGFPGSSVREEPACNSGDMGWEDPLEAEMAT